MRKNIIWGFLLFLVIWLIYNFSEHSRWVSYFNGKVGMQPRSTFIKASKYLGTPGKALSIGTGVGNDEAILLEQGWCVDCIEPHVKALEIIHDRKEFKAAGNKVKYIKKKLEDLMDDELDEKYDFIYAGYSLPFIKPSEFKPSWQKVKAHFARDGIFAGHFFGEYHKHLNVRHVNRLTRAELDEILADFEVLSLKEVHQNGNHVYKVIAKKK